MTNTDEIDEALHDLDLAGPFGSINKLEEILERLPPLHPKARELSGFLTVRLALEENIEPPSGWSCVLMSDIYFKRGFMSACSLFRRAS